MEALSIEKKEQMLQICDKCRKMDLQGDEGNYIMPCSAECPCIVYGLYNPPN